MNRHDAKELERDIRRVQADAGDMSDVLARIDTGLAEADEPGAIGLLLLGRALARQMEADPSEVGADALAASELLEQAGEYDAAVFAEAVGGALLHRAGDVDAATHIAVRSLAALERMPTTEEWGSRTAHCLGLLFGELHAYELAARSSARSLAWQPAREDPLTRLTIETVRGYFAARAAANQPDEGPQRRECLDMVSASLDALAELATPAACIAADALQAELDFLNGEPPDPDRLAQLAVRYPECALPWVAWHELLHGRALNEAGRHGEAIPKLTSSLEKPWPFGLQEGRRELARAFAGEGRTDEAIAEFQAVLDDLDQFVRTHVARQATDLAERVEAEKHSTELRRRTEQLTDQIAHDHLTGVASRRALDGVLDRPVDGVSDHAVLICDLDHFKLINDAYGHAVGDDVLVEIGHIFRSHARSGDITGRFGGEEFVVVSRVDEVGAAEIAERLRAAVENTRWTEIAEDLKVTLSIGLAVGTTPLRDLLRAADMAVYEAKDAGRNRVHVATVGSSPDTNQPDAPPV